MKMPQLSHDLAPHEQQLGKYRLIAKLGQGGMGTVYLALASGLGSFRKLLVVKELRHDLPWRESSLSMFLDEAQLAARLDHPNVLQTFEAGEADGRYFLAMEYLDGQPLSTLIDHGIPLELHVYILCEVLQGLQYAHELTDYDGSLLHVVHRDVSPQNVFVTYHGQVKIVDFGVAKANNGSNITSPGVFKGKFAYAAPEQLLGRPVDGRCDVFAVGVMLWEAIAGRRFGVPKPTVDAFRVRTQGLEPRIAQVAPDVDPLLAEICDHALVVDPLERMESAEALRARLQQWLDLQGEHIQAKHIAELMRERFSEDRAARQRVIERAMIDAGASQSTIAELPRELFDRESGTAPRVEHPSSSGINPQPAAPARAPQPAAPKLSHADESVHSAKLRRPAPKPNPSRASSAAVLLIVAASVFGLTYQLSRRATEPPPNQPRPAETSTSPATAANPTTPPTPTTPTLPTSPVEPHKAASTPRAINTREPSDVTYSGARNATSRPSDMTTSGARDVTSRGASDVTTSGALDSTLRGISAREPSDMTPPGARDATSHAADAHDPGDVASSASRDPALRGVSPREPSDAHSGTRDAASRGVNARDSSDASSRGARAQGDAVSSGMRDSALRASNVREQSGGAARVRDSAQRESGVTPAISAQTAAGRARSEERATAAVSGAVQPKAAAKLSTSLARPGELEPAKPAATRASEERPPSKARPAGRDAHMGSDIRQLRSGAPMRIDTEDPYK